MSKFVGKFRKNRNYNDDYNYDNKRHRNEHSESKKQLQRVRIKDLEEFVTDGDNHSYHSNAESY